jgi:hypothetical protein
MRGVVGVVLGIVTGACLSSLLQACTCESHHDTPPGRFVGFGANAGSAIEPDYELVITADGQATERYTRSGKSYAVSYAASP